MKSTQRVSSTLHVMAVAILASGFIGNLLVVSADEPVASNDRTKLILLADSSAGHADLSGSA